MKKKSINAEEFDTLFEEGADIVEYLATEKAERPGLKQRRVSVDFPSWMSRVTRHLSRFFRTSYIVNRKS
ncbi:MAG: hypothetical protein WCR01_15660 [Bacteroidota bacterium]